MTEREAFIEAIAANPGDDTARLAFADWLQEHGEDARAEFVRLQCAIACRNPTSDESEEYDHYPQQNPDPDKARVHGLLTGHWHEWFGPVLAAVGMPPPGARVVPAKTSGYSLYPPYAIGSHWGPLPRHLPIVFERELNSRRGRSLRAKRFLSSLRLDRGFVTGLSANLANAGPRCDLAAALRLEPVAALDLWLTASGNWTRLSHPALKRLRQLVLRFGSEQPNYDEDVGPILNDTRLTGIRELTLSAEDEYDSGPLALADRGVETLLNSAIAPGLQVLHTGAYASGVAALADSDALPELRELNLQCVPGAGPATGSFGPYRGRLERLSLSDLFDTSLLGRGRPWERLTSLHLQVRQVAPWITCVDPAVFPALTQLRLGGTSVAAVRDLAGVLRAGRFPHLATLAVTGSVAGSLIALAEAVAPTNIRELDLHTIWDHSDAEYERVRALLGDRVRIDPPGEAIPF